MLCFVDAVLRNDDVATGTCGIALRSRLVSHVTGSLVAMDEDFFLPIECYE